MIAAETKDLTNTSFTNLGAISTKLELVTESYLGSTELHQIWLDACKDHSIFHIAISQFDNDTTREAAISLRGAHLENALRKLGNEITDGEYISIWESLEVCRKTAITAEIATLMLTQADTIPEQLVSELRRVPGLPENVDFDAVQNGLGTLLIDWSSHIQDKSWSEAAFEFLRDFLSLVLGSTNAPTNLWEVLLLKLERAIKSDSGGQWSPLSAVFRLIWDGLQFQPALVSFMTLSEEYDEVDRSTASYVAALAFCEANRGKFRAQVIEGLSPNYVLSMHLNGAFTDENAFWRETLSSQLERSFAEIFTDGATAAAALHGKLEMILQMESERLEACQQFSNDLSQGMAGADTASLLSSYCNEIIKRALFASLLSFNVSEAKSQFLGPIIRDLSFDPRCEIWRKYPQMLAMLRTYLTDLRRELPGSQAASLLKAAEQRGTTVLAKPIRWMDDHGWDQAFSARTDSDRLDRKSIRLIKLSLQRQLVEQRLNGAQAQSRLNSWLADNAFEGTLSNQLETFIPQFNERFKTLASNTGEADTQTKVPTLVREGLGLVSRLERISAAVSLIKRANTIATEVADEVIASLPEYAEKIGTTGRVSCIRDNSLTLSQIAEVILSGVDEPEELLTEWWTSAVGAYLNNRPEKLFETNLSALYRSINQHLETTQGEIAFRLIQSVYAETLGVVCHEALASRPLRPIGPIAELRVIQCDTLEVIEPSSLADSIINSMTEEIAEARPIADTVAKQFIDFVDLRKTYRDSDIAVSALIPELKSTSNNLFTPDVISGLSRALNETNLVSDSKTYIFLNALFGEYSQAVSQSKIGLCLQENATQIAKSYAEAMITFAPKHFEGLNKEESTAKCARDQSLLLKKIGTLLSNSSPTVFWFDITRYYLELLAPNVDYTVHIWRLSFRTIVKHLGHDMCAPGNLFLAKWLSQAEQIAESWATGHMLSKTLFDPSDYSFSAREEEDKLHKDLLTAAIVADASGRNAPWNRDDMFNRFLLSWAAADRDTDGISSIVEQSLKVAGSFLSRSTTELVQSAPIRVETLRKNESSDSSDSQTTRSIYDDALVSFLSSNSKRLKIVPEIRNYSEKHPNSAPVLYAALHIFCIDEHFKILGFEWSPRIKELKQSKLAEQKVSANATCSETGRVNISVEAIGNTEDLIIEGFKRRLAEVEKGWLEMVTAETLICLGKEHAESLVNDMNSDDAILYSRDINNCDNETNVKALSYCFRQSGFSAIDPTILSPRLFYGLAADNLLHFSNSVVSSAHSRTNLSALKVLEGRSLQVSQAVNESDTLRLKPSGPAWEQLVRNGISEAGSQTQLGAAKVIQEIRSSTGFLSKSHDPSKSKDNKYVHNALTRPLTSFVTNLLYSGDVEYAHSELLSDISPALAKEKSTEILFPFASVVKSLKSSLESGSLLFWQYHLQNISSVLRQALVGMEIEENAAAAAKSRAKQMSNGKISPTVQKQIYNQTHRLKRFGCALQTDGAQLAWLNFAGAHFEFDHQFFKETEDAPFASWCFYDKWFCESIDKSLRGTALTWFGILEKFTQTASIYTPIASAIFPQLIEQLRKDYGGDFYDWLKFCNSFLAACATPDNSLFTPVGLIERLLIATPLNINRTASDWKDICATIESFLQGQDAARIPNILKKLLAELPEAASRIDLATTTDGSPINRFIASNPNSVNANASWNAFILARVIEDEKSLLADPADLMASQKLNVELVAESELCQTLKQYKSAVNSIDTLSVERPKATGFLSKIGLKNDKKKPWMDNIHLLDEAKYIIETLTLAVAVGTTEPSMDQLYGYPLPSSLDNAEESLDSILFYKTLSNALSTSLGPDHTILQLFDRFVTSYSDAQAGMQIGPTEKHASAYVALCLMNLRSHEDASLYMNATNAAEDLDTFSESLNAKTQSAFNDEQLESIRTILTILKRNT